MAAVVQIIFAFRSQGICQLIWKLLLGIIYLLAGVYIVANPAMGALALTLALGVTIFAQGVIEPKTILVGRH